MASPSVLVPLAAGFEELEAVTIIDLLVRAGIEVKSAGLEAGAVQGSRGVVLLPDMSLDEALQRPFTMVVLPGGAGGADRLSRDPRIALLLARVEAEQGYLAAICAAPKVLAQQGYLQNRQATGYPGVLEASAAESIEISSEAVVRSGSIITSQGPATAMAFALTLIEILVGRAQRDEVAAGLLYREPQA